MPKIPFGWLPGHWGLKGKTRLRAQAEHELSGMALDMRLAEIDHDQDPDQLALAQLDIKLRHKLIDAYDHDVASAQIRMKSDPFLEEVLLNLELKHNRISQHTHDRKLADLRSEPWVNMPDIKWDPQDPSRSYFELDYNDHFITFLKSHNYTGASDDQIVEKWLTDVCRSVAVEFAQSDPTFVSDHVTPVTKKRQPRKRKTEYS
jgi:hypothetical protein